MPEYLYMPFLETAVLKPNLSIRNVHSRSAGRPTIHLLKELGIVLFSLSDNVYF